MLFGLFFKIVAANFYILIRKIFFIILLFLFCLFFIPNSITSQIKFKTRHLEEIYSCLRENAKSIEAINFHDNLSHTFHYQISNSYGNFVIKVDAIKGTIEHFGLNLFPTSYDSIYNPVILRFTERELLYYLLSDNNKVKEIIEQNKLILKLNGNQYGTMGFYNITSIISILFNSKLTINCFQNHLQPTNSYYEVIWKDNDQNIVEFTFPARYDLIKGMDKIELESEFFTDLENLGTIRYKRKIIEPDWKRLERVTDSIFIFKKDKNFYNFTSNIFYHNQKTIYKPVIDQNYLIESLTNYIQLSLFDSSITVNTKVNGYGNKINNIKVGFSKMLDFFSKEHKLFIGFEEMKNDSIPVTILFVNYYFNYLHLLTVSVPKQFLFDDSNFEFNGDFYPYIRLDNIKDIFSDYNEGKSKFNIKIKQ